MKKVLLVSLFVPVDLLVSQTSRPDTAEYFYPGEVVISALRIDLPLSMTPFSISLVQQEKLTVLPRGAAVDEALKLVPGVKVDNQANGKRVHLSIRGQGILTETGIRSIKILLDELPLNDPTGFVPDLYDVNYDVVERIEVSRGPAGSLYGGAAASGIINIITQNTSHAPISGSIAMTSGSNNFWKGFGQFGGDAKDVNYLVSMSRTAGDGYRIHTHFWQSAVYAKGTYSPVSAIQLTPIVSWSDTYHENPEGLSLAQFLSDPKLANPDAIRFNEHMEMNRMTGGVAGVIRLPGGQEVRFNTYVRHSHYTEANNRIFDHQSLTTPGTSVQYSCIFGPSSGVVSNEVSLGTDLQWQVNDEHLNPNDYSVKVDSVLAKQRTRQSGARIYLIDVLNMNASWNLMGNIRFDNIRNKLTDLMATDSSNNSGSADFSNVTGRLGVIFSPSPTLTLFGNWGQGFIPPSTEELGTNPSGYGGFNRNLIAATSNCFEIGSRGKIVSIDYSITGFYMLTRNDFDRYRISGRGHGEEGTFYKNVGASRRFGLELSATCQPVTPLVLQLAYTYSHFKYDIAAPIPILMDDTTIHKFIRNGNWLPNSPQHQIMVDIDWKVLSRLSFGLTAEALSKTYIDGANIESEAAPGYTLVGSRIVYNWAAFGFKGTLAGHIRNITNKMYIAFTEPDPGENAYQPGAGREFFLNLRISP